jgi:hypothetical protein
MNKTEPVTAASPRQRFARLVGRLILLAVIAGTGYVWMQGMSSHKASADMAKARSCADLPQLFGQLHDFAWCDVVIDNKIARFQIPHDDPDAVKTVEKTLDGQNGKLMFVYIGSPNRGHFTVDVDGRGKVTGVEPFQMSD